MTSAARKLAEVRHVIDVPHVKDCWAVEAVKRGDWPTAWCSVLDKEEPFAWRDQLGRRRPVRGGGRAWLRLLCNSTNCNGRLLLYIDDALPGLEPARSVSKRKPVKR